MNSFEPGFLDRQQVTPSLVATIRLLGEYKGKQALHTRQAPQVLEALRDLAVVQSTESSNRIEGITALPERVELLAAQKTTPRDRSEQEIAGYRDVLATIHVNATDMSFTPGLVLQLHRDLYGFVPGEGGRWKPTDNEIMDILPSGARRVRFKPVSAAATAQAMSLLHERFNILWEGGEHDRLLLIPAYVLDFLCVHPFLDGNGRIARLLTLLLLYRAGYEVGRYISLERIVEETKETYYEALLASSQGWHEAEHTLLPWWEYLLGVNLLAAYREFEARVGQVTSARGAKTDMVRTAIEHLPRRFRYADIARACPNVSRPTIHRVLAQLRDAGEVRCVVGGRDAVWEKA